MLSASRGPREPEQWVALVNHNANTWWILPSASILDEWARISWEPAGVISAVAAFIFVAVIAGANAWWIPLLLFLSGTLIGGLLLLEWGNRVSESQRLAVRHAMEGICRECLITGPLTFLD